MDYSEQPSMSHLFTIRVWQEELGAGRFEWRGRVQEAATGEAGYFRDWPGLVAVLAHLLAPYGDAAKAPKA